MPSKRLLKSINLSFWRRTRHCISSIWKSRRWNGRWTCSGSDLSDFAQEHVVLKQPKSVVCGRFSFCRYSGDLNIGLVWYSKVVRSLNGLLFEWCSEYHTLKVFYSDVLFSDPHCISYSLLVFCAFYICYYYSFGNRIQ